MRGALHERRRAALAGNANHLWGALSVTAHWRFLAPNGRASRGVGLALAVALAATGCAVGPDFKPPAAPAAASGAAYTPTPLAAQTASAPGPGGIEQRYLSSQDIPAQWWTLFHSEPLERLIQDALAHNPTLASAQAALRESRETLAAQSGSLLYPSVTGQLGATRERSNETIPGLTVFNLYNAAVQVSYTVDAFGASRRELESLAAAVEYQRFEVEATYLTLASNVVTAAISEASLRAQLQATNEVLDAQQKQLDLVQRQFALGAVPRSSLLSQRTTVAQTRATVPPLEKSLAQTRHQLSVYAGRLPSESGLPEFELASLQLPPELPLSLPSALVRQRPDIRASEALLHEASAQVGVATANLYPQITLSGSLGYEALKASTLFNKANQAWSFGASLTEPIFNGGALRAKRRAALAAYEQADAQYRATVLSAFQNVADSLRAIDADALALKADADTEALAHEQLDLSPRQYRLGALSYLSLLDAQRSYQQARITLVQAQAARYADTAALLQALGGGWWHRPELADLARAAPQADAAPQ